MVAVAVVAVVRVGPDAPGDPSPGPDRRWERLRADPGSLLPCVGSPAPGDGSVPAGGVPAQVAQIAARVEAIRELSFEEPPEPTFLGPGQTARRIRRLFLADYTPALAEAERRMLVALGAVPPEIDLRRARARALGQQVAGFYLPDEGDLVVRLDAGGLDVIDRITLAHELQHALADQNLGLPVPDRLRVGREDEDLAALTLIEGDATLTMHRYAFTLPLRDQLGLLEPAALEEAREGLRRLPHYLRQELLFPYEQGLAFVCHLFEEGGWDAVDEAYRAPPRSTGEVLFAGRYPSPAPADPPDPGGPGPGWEAGPARSFGAANLLWLLEAPGGRRARAVEGAEDAAAAWAGGEIHLWRRGPDSAAAVVLAERPGQDVLCEAVSAWYMSAFPRARPSGAAEDGGLRLEGARQDAVVRCAEDLVLLSVAPDPATAEAVASGVIGGAG